MLMMPCSSFSYSNTRGVKGGAAGPRAQGGKGRAAGPQVGPREGRGGWATKPADPRGKRGGGRGASWAAARSRPKKGGRGNSLIYLFLYFPT
jgi:hypothetical protein